MTPTQQFAAWLAPAMRRAGYDIDKQMGGGRLAFAKAVGVAASTVTRWLAGQSMPDPEKFELIANALGVPVVDMLVEVGIISSQLANEQRDPAVRSSPMTPSEIADELGIHGRVEREMFFGVIDRLTRTPREPSEQGVDGGAAAEG